MKHFTNLNPRSAIPAFAFAPCWMPHYPVSDRAKLLLVDHETDNEAIERGDPAAVAKAKEIFADARAKAPHAQLGWFGWPFCLQQSEVPAKALAWADMVAMADYLAPCCYAGHAADTLIAKRGKWFDDCIAIMGPSAVAKPRVGVVCEWTLDSKHRCTEAQIAAQIEAARIADCDCLYVWSGLPARIHAANMVAEYGMPSYDAINMARAELLGNYGFRIREWSASAVAGEYARVAKVICARFAKAWRESA